MPWQAEDSLRDTLARAGFSGNRLSIWGLQVSYVHYAHVGMLFFWPLPLG